MPRIQDDVKLDFNDVLICPKRSELKSRSEVQLIRDYHFRNSKKCYSGVPIMAANMDTTGTFETAKALAEISGGPLMTAVHKHYTTDEWLNFANSFNSNGVENAEVGSTKPEPTVNALSNIAISAGTSLADIETVRAVLDKVPAIQFICLDVANGYSQFFVDTVRKVREEFDGKTLIAGNIVTAEMVEELLMSGADIVKVGIGPGSVCTTRKKTGVGYPQLSAVMECADAAHGLRGHIISDGGCTCPGDVAKAFAGGADFVMIGGMLAGHDQSGGELIERNGKKYKLFYGMASKTAQTKHRGGLADYRASEGKTITIPYRGDITNTVRDILGGLRSACTYVGASKLKELSRRATFIRVRRQLNEMYTPFETEAADQ